MEAARYKVPNYNYLQPQKAGNHDLCTHLGRSLVLLASVERLEFHGLQQEIQLRFAILRGKELAKLDLLINGVVEHIVTSTVCILCVLTFILKARHAHPDRQYEQAVL